MKDFERLLDAESSDDLQHKSLELPKETEEVNENTELTKDSGVEDVNIKDMLNPNDIQMSWTKVNTSRWCGCNNACYNSCFNVG